jgi:hypothetical protein
MNLTAHLSRKGLFLQAQRRVKLPGAFARSCLEHDVRRGFLFIDFLLLPLVIKIRFGGCTRPDFSGCLLQNPMISPR